VRRLGSGRRRSSVDTETPRNPPGPAYPRFETTPSGLGADQSQGTSFVGRLTLRRAKSEQPAPGNSSVSGCRQSLSRLAETGRSDFDIGVDPGFLKARLDLLRLVVFFLQPQAAGQAEERPAIVGELLQVV